jgi:anaphase-promoting complex subunit 8
MLNSLPEQSSVDDDSQMLNTEAPQPSFQIFSTSYDDPNEATLEAREAPRYLLAKSYFDTREFDRCAAVFVPPAIPAGGLAIFEKTKTKTKSHTPSPSKVRTKAKQDESVSNPFPNMSQRSLFLALYARYLSGEKRREEETEMVLGPADGGQTVNKELPALSRGLHGYFQARDSADPELKRSQGWLEFLYGIILARSKQEVLAQQWLLRSVRLNPYHWGAWEELAALLSSVDDLNAHLASPLLPQNIMTIFYQTHANVDLFSTTDATATFSSLNTLLSIFPTSTFLRTQLALCHYHGKDFETSASIFQDLLTSHPYRLDALDHYSNILYVMEDRPKLAFLAHLATAVDKFRPETCCVVGNYYSLCSQHEKAVMYFRRALTLDRSFLSAWTLMGHEYIELKNTHAAIESYRRAVDVNRKDYRAWYGLGQAYEVLDMLFYALFYYQRAAGLRPYDPKMWQAVGSCYAKMERHDQAIKALKRALSAGTYFESVNPTPQQSFGASMNSTTSTARLAKPHNGSGRKLLDPDTLYSIAQLYERMQNEGEAAKYMELCLAQETGAGSKRMDAADKVQASKTSRVRKRIRTQHNEKLIEYLRLRQQAGEARDNETSMQTDETEDADGDTEVLSSPSDVAEEGQTDDDAEAVSDLEEDADDDPDDDFGTGTTATTSKARLWLARHAFQHGQLEKAERLAEELCMDGFEVEEAKSLVREVRARRDGVVGAREGGMDEDPEAASPS